MRVVTYFLIGRHGVIISIAITKFDRYTSHVRDTAHQA